MSMFFTLGTLVLGPPHPSHSTPFSVTLRSSQSLYSNLSHTTLVSPNLRPFQHSKPVSGTLMHAFKDANDCHVHKGIRRHRGAHELAYTPTRKHIGLRAQESTPRPEDWHKSAGPFCEGEIRGFCYQICRLGDGPRQCLSALPLSGIPPLAHNSHMGRLPSFPEQT